jgi:hypothetical protein
MNNTGSIIGRTYPSPSGTDERIIRSLEKIGNIINTFSENVDRSIELSMREFSDRVIVLSEGRIPLLQMEKHLKGGCFLVDYKDCTFKVTEYKNRGSNAYVRMEVKAREMKYKRFLTSNWETITNPEPFMVTYAEHTLTLGIPLQDEKYKEFYVPVKRELVGWNGYNFDINLLTGSTILNNHNTTWLK